MDRPLPELPGVEHRFVDAAGLRVHIAEAGAGDPLVLQHGWPQHWLAWSRLIPALAESYRVICPDMRGLGWSDAPPRGYDKEQLASDLLAVLDALELERVRMVGHDWGGFAAFLAAFRAPERFERFCCLSIATPWLRVSRSPGAFARTAYQPLIASPGLGRRVVPRLVPLIFKRGSGGRLPWTQEELASFRDQFRERERASASVQIYRTFLRRELRPILRGRYADRRLTVPTLLLYGAEDPVINEERLGPWRDRSDRMTVEELPGAAHFLPEEAPDAVLSRLVPFLR
jgi:pimeloyl-ACP methyl ester carboxylesterase